MSGIISDEALLELERQRVQLRTTLRNKGRTPTDNETMDNLVSDVDYLQSADFLSDFANGTLTEVVSDEITSTRVNLFKGLKALEKVSLPNLTQLGDSAFDGCTSLKHINISNMTMLQKETGSNFYCFRNTQAKVIYLPKVTSVGETNYIFAYMPNLEKLFVPLTTLGIRPFDSTTSIKYIETKEIQSQLANQTNLETVVIRNNSVISLSNTSYIPNNTCVFYVPQDLIASYKTATNWSALTNINDRLIALEGSDYEDDDWYENTQEYRQEVLGEE